MRFWTASVSVDGGSLAASSSGSGSDIAMVCKRNLSGLYAIELLSVLSMILSMVDTVNAKMSRCVKRV